VNWGLGEYTSGCSQGQEKWAMLHANERLSIKQARYAAPLALIESTQNIYLGCGFAAICNYNGHAEFASTRLPGSGFPQNILLTEVVDATTKAFSGSRRNLL
jgi:hypothetical protein